MHELHMNTMKYERKKETVVKNFFGALASHEQASYLSEILPEPTNYSRKVRRLYMECRAPKSAKKKAILNWALLIYSTTLIKKKYRNYDLKDPKIFADAQL